MEREFYEEYFYFEEKYWWFRGREKIISFFIQKYLKDKISPRILDVGTGTGRTFEFLSKYGEVTGIDNSDEAIKFCSKRNITDVIKTDVRTIPFEDFSFDIVIAMDIIEHLDEDIIAVREFYRVLRKDGVLLLTVPAFMFLWGRHDEINMHRKRYNIWQISQIIKKAGFQIEKLSYYNFFLFPIVFLTRFGRKVLKVKEKKLKSDLKEIPSFINKLLEKIFSFERFLLRRWNLPFGVSLICVAKK